MQSEFNHKKKNFVLFNRYIQTPTATRKSCGKPQEAYRPRQNLSQHNLSREGGTPSLAGGHPILGWGSSPIMRYPPSWPGTSHWGTPTNRLLNQWKYYLMGMEYPPPPERMWDQWEYYGMEMLWDGDGLPPRPEQTHACKNITLLRTRAVKNLVITPTNFC